MRATRVESEKALQALRRAGKIARERAAAHNHKIAVVRDGKVVHIDPKQKQA